MESTPSGWWDEVIEALRPFDPADLLASIGALQLMPENAERALRLEALASLASVLPRADGKPEISGHRLRQICNGPLLAHIHSLEDPSEQAFTEAIAFIGGSYIVFPGVVEDATFILRHFVRAIIGYENPVLPTTFLNAAVHTLGAGLTVSNLVASRAGLSRGVAPASTSSDLCVPPSREFRRLKDAVCIELGELERSLRLYGFDIAVLEPLTAGLGSPAVDEDRAVDELLEAHPLVRFDNSVILAAPALLSAALRHRLICLAQEYDVLDVLATRYRNAVWHTVQVSLRHMEHMRTNILLPPMADGLPTVDGVFALDTDKLLYAVLVSDDFDQYDNAQVFGPWTPPGLSQILEERQRQVEEYLAGTWPGLNAMAVLFLVAGIGRSYSLGFDRPIAPLENPRVIMNAADLEIIALIEGENSLLLWKYAIASEKVRDRTEIFAWSQLDEFYLYRKRQYSYYLSDERRPDFVSIAPGSGLELRLEAINDFDFHGVPAFKPELFIEVARIVPGHDMPIYSSMELARRRSRFCQVVEELPVYVWVIGPDYEQEPEQRDIGHVYMEVVDMVAYWLWQFTPSLTPLLQPYQEESPVIVIEIRANPDDDWLARGNGEDETIASYDLLESENTIVLYINPGLQPAIGTPDNQGERSLMAIVLQALDELIVGPGNETQLTPGDIEEILDRHAPLGRKKKALILDASLNPALGATGLPTHRNVQMADKSALLDVIGEYLVSELQLPVGPIPGEERTSVLQRVVGFLYQKLQSVVATLNPDNLLDWLIGYHEAILYDAAYLRLTVPTRMACFGADEAFTSQVGQDLRQFYEAGQAARFIIEYVSAQPPAGLHPMSLSVYDEIQALAIEIIQWAGISDLIHYGISDIEISVLPSGRLGSTYRMAFERALGEFLPLHSSERIDWAAVSFDRHWSPVESARDSFPVESEEVDRAFHTEFGYTLTELTTLMEECYVLGLEQQAPVKRLSIEEMVARLVRSTDLPEQKVNHMLEALTLERRRDFLEPPAPFRQEDVYPWRFGRPLSYMRRPLIKTVQNGQLTYVWGNLHLHEATNFIVNACWNGRLQSQARSQELRSLSALINSKTGQAFTLNVAAVFAANDGLIVDANVRQIGRTRIAQEGNDLGDIDVLVINPRHRRLLVVECKDLSVARNPHEMANEIQRLFVGTSTKTATVVRHQRRTDWVARNRALVLEHYGINVKGKWRIEPIIVVSEEMFTPHLYNPPMPVISFLRLERDFAPQWS